MSDILALKSRGLHGALRVLFECCSFEQGGYIEIREIMDRRKVTGFNPELPRQLAP